MIATNVKRPRNVDVPRAAAILYGDWGTSKAYVIGLAFAVAGYASFWLIAAMCVLTALVGDQLHDHLPALSGRRRRLRQRAPSLRSDLDRRRVSPHRRLSGHCRDQRAFGLSISRRAASGKIRRRRHPHHRPTQPARPETHRRSGFSDFGSDGDRCRRARALLSAAPRRQQSGICSRCTGVSGTTGRLCRYRARAFWRRSDRQRHRRHETRSRQHRREIHQSAKLPRPQSCG